MPEAPRLDALMLAGDLPGLLLDAQRLAAFAPGAHGRRRAGQGEAFWQYRDHRSEDGARLVDWRRSARGDRFYVREREREAAQTAWFWIDPEPGFNWSSGPNYPSKKRRALTLALALGVLLTRGGERIGALGRASRAGARSVERMALDLVAPAVDAAPAAKSCVVFASDFYAPLEQWRAKLNRAASAGAYGALLMVADPAEEDFPYVGRTLFRAPGGREEALLGRADAAREGYAARLNAHRRSLRTMSAALGFPAVLHRTDHAAGPALGLLMALVAERRR